MNFISNFIAVRLQVVFYQSCAYFQVYIAKTSDYFEGGVPSSNLETLHGYCSLKVFYHCDVKKIETEVPDTFLS